MLLAFRFAIAANWPIYRIKKASDGWWWVRHSVKGRPYWIRRVGKSWNSIGK
jgi:hypothetical protein